MRPRVILLPGLHGTAGLFDSFRAAIPEEYSTRTIEYPRKRALGYRALLAYLEGQLAGERSMLLIAESFSGAIALRYACAHPERVKAVILCASFISTPVPPVLSWLGAPLALLCAPIPSIAIRMFIAGRRAPREIVQAVRREVFSVSPHVIAQRMVLTTMVRAGDALKKCPVPLLCLAGERDRLIGPRAARRIRRVRPNSAMEMLDTPHLLLQTRPVEAWRQIERFLATLA